MNKWTIGLAAIGVISLASVAKADEKMGSAMNAVSSTTLSGYVDTSMQWNLGPGDTHAPGYKYGGASKADGFNLDVVKLTLEKPLNEDEWAAGYKVDLLFVPDANVFGTTSKGAGFNTSDFAIKQAYVALRAPVGNGIDFKVGVFDSVIGYESTETINNPNFTRSWAHTFEPSTHTGVLATYQFCKMFRASLGVADTLSPTINGRSQEPAGGGTTTANNGYKTVLGSVAFTAPDTAGFLSGSELYAGFVNGFNSGEKLATTTGNGATYLGANQTSYYVGATIATPVTGLRLGAAYDVANVSAQPLTGNNGHGNFNAVSGYASFQATEKLSLHGRLEYADMPRGTAQYLDDSGSGFGGGIAHQMLSYTATVQYDLWKNVLSRVEFRWDHALDDSKAFGANGPAATGALPAGNYGSLNNSYEILANVVYKF